MWHGWCIPQQNFSAVNMLPWYLNTAMQLVYLCTNESIALFVYRMTFENFTESVNNYTVTIFKLDYVPRALFPQDLSLQYMWSTLLHSYEYTCLYVAYKYTHVHLHTDTYAHTQCTYRHVIIEKIFNVTQL